MGVPAAASETVETNPLLKVGSFPQYDKVEATHVVPGIRNVLKELETELENLEQNAKASWESLVHPLERIIDRLIVTWGVVSHLKAVRDSSELRGAVEQVQPEKVAFLLRLGQSKPIYEAFKEIRDGAVFKTLSEAQQRIVEDHLKEATLTGVALEGDTKERFNEIQQELQQLATKFNEQVLDSTKQFERLITDKSEIDGLPPTALALAAQTAASKGHEGATPESGPWMLTLDMPSYMPVMKFVKNRALREEMYRAYITVASKGDLDNTPVINRILELRLEKAKLLGYKNYAEVSMVQKMATLERAEELLEKLRSSSWNGAIKDLEDLKAFSKEKIGPPLGEECALIKGS